MEEFVISHSEKGFLAERESKYRQILEGWKHIFKDCTRKEAVLLENIIHSRSLLEAGMTSDIGGYDGFVLNMVRRVYANMISKDLVSVQPMTAPMGRVFYLDALVTTGTSSNYQSMYDSHYDSANYDVSKGAYTWSSGSSIIISATNYNSGTSFNIPYLGGTDGLASLNIWADANQYSDMVLVNGTNGVVTAGGGIVADATKAFDNITDYTTSTALLTNTIPAWIKFGFSTTPSVPVTKYSFFYGNNTGSSNWKLCGSTDNTTWVLLDNRIGESNVSQAISYYVPNDISTPYKWYLFTGMTATTGFIHLTEVELMSGSTIHERLNYAISPTTWSNDIAKNNQLDVIVHQTGSSMVGNISAFTEWKTYTGNEGVSGMQQMKLNVTSSTVEATSRKLAAVLTEEILQDAQAYFGLNYESELAELISTEIAAEIDREIVRDLIAIAPYRSEWYYDISAVTSAATWYSGDSGYTLSSVTQYRWAQDSLLTKINQMDAQLRKANIYHGANWLLCSTKVGMVIESMKEHKCLGGEKIVDRSHTYRTGKLKSTIDVYVDPYLPDNVCLLGYNGDNWDAGYIFAPYVLATTDPAVRDPDVLFDFHLNFHSRYATKVISNKKYGLINCTFPTGGEFLLVNEV